MRKNDSFIKLVVFTLGQTNYAIVSDNVLEIVDSGTITHVPNINQFVEGAYNFKSRIIPIFDLKKIVGMDMSTKNNEAHKILIMTYEDRLIGFKIDDVVDIFHLASFQLKTVILKNFHSGIEGIGEIQSLLFFYLNIEKIIQSKKPFELEAQDYIIKEYKEAKKK